MRANAAFISLNAIVANAALLNINDTSIIVNQHDPNSFTALQPIYPTIIEPSSASANSNTPTARSYIATTTEIDLTTIGSFITIRPISVETQGTETIWYTSSHFKYVQQSSTRTQNDAQTDLPALRGEGPVTKRTEVVTTEGDRGSGVEKALTTCVPYMGMEACPIPLVTTTAGSGSGRGKGDVFGMVWSRLLAIGAGVKAVGTQTTVMEVKVMETAVATTIVQVDEEAWALTTLAPALGSPEDGISVPPTRRLVASGVTAQRDVAMSTEPGGAGPNRTISIQ